MTRSKLGRPGLTAILSIFISALAGAQSVRLAEVPFTSFATTGGTLKITPGSAMTLDLGSWSPPAGPSSVQWYHDDIAISGATQAELRLTNLAPSDSGNYRAAITTPLGTTWTANTVAINVQPLPPSGIDDSFTTVALPDESGPGTRSPLAFMPDGRIAIRYATAGGTGIAVLQRDGSLQSQFLLPASNGVLLTTTADGRLLFSRAPHLRAATGEALDFTLPATFDPNTPLEQIDALADGKLLLRQGFTLVRCLADGTQDATFTPIDLEPGDYQRHTVDAQGRVYVSNQRIRPHPFLSDLTEKTASCIRYGSDGLPDTTFIPIGAESVERGRHWAYDLFIRPLDDGRLVVLQRYGSAANIIQLHREDGSLIAGSPLDLGLQYWPPLVDVVRHRLFLNGEKLARVTIHATGFSIDETAYFGFLEAAWRFDFPFLAPTGELYVGTYNVSGAQRAGGGFVRLRQDLTLPSGFAPHVDLVFPIYWTLHAGSDVTLRSQISGDAGLAYQWLALDGQTLPAVTTAAELTIPNFQAQHLGRYQLRVSNAYGSTLSAVFDLLAADRPTTLANLSGRAVPGEGDNALIAGFSATPGAGAGPWLLFRGVGPGLVQYGITQPVSDPELRLFNVAGEQIGDNDTWGPTTNARNRFNAVGAKVGAFPLPTDSADAALERGLHDREPYTVQLVNKGATNGPGLIEIYEATDERKGLRNLSLRARTGPGLATANAGFVLTDYAGFGRPARVLLRAVGQGMQAYGVSDTLNQPRLTLHRADGTVLRQGGPWHREADAAQIRYATPVVGAFPLAEDGTDAAMVAELAPGAYSLTVDSLDPAQLEGVVILEVYLLP